MSQLTGKRRYRVGGWRRHVLILQVEVKDTEWDFARETYVGTTTWRDAGVEDLMTIEAVHRPFPVMESVS